MLPHPPLGQSGAPPTVLGGVRAHVAPPSLRAVRGVPDCPKGGCGEIRPSALRALRGAPDGLKEAGGQFAATPLGIHGRLGPHCLDGWHGS